MGRKKQNCGLIQMFWEWKLLMDRVAAAQQDLPPALPPSTLPTSLFDLVGRESSSKDQSKRGKKNERNKGLDWMLFFYW
jgi:hypothetical protein